jgi:hypothetical protein
MQAKRVVIETTSNGESFWRFVPRAKREEGCEDEGVWPRIIEVCGYVIMLLLCFDIRATLDVAEKLWNAL